MERTKLSKQQKLTFLNGVRKDLETPDKWLQNRLALTANNRKINAESKSAYKFCLLGALLHNVFDYSKPIKRKLYDSDQVNQLFNLMDLGGVRMSITAFNDSPNRTHRQVIDAIDAAIIAVKQESR